MGRGKIAIRRIENKTTRQVTFAKRRAGLVKKTHELSILCDAQIGLVVFSSSGKKFEYCSPSTSMDQIIRKYEHAKGVHIPQHDEQDQMQDEMRKMRRDTHALQLSVERCIGSDLSSMQLDELPYLEHQFECSVTKVRARKFELLEQQTENLRRKVKMLQEENAQIFNLIKEHETTPAMEHQEQRVGEVLKLQEPRNVFDQFPFMGEEQPRSVVLQLGMFPSPYQPYRLQPTQPNLQDFTLLPPTYE